jgi:hypothetical protein
MLAAAALKLQLSRLLLEDMITMRKNGVFNWKKHYEQAVVLCGQVGVWQGFEWSITQGGYMHAFNHCHRQVLHTGACKRWHVCHVDA